MDKVNMQELQEKLLAFADARDWAQFQSPKNLSMALTVEASELMEHFQWLTEAQSKQLCDEKRREVAHELADVFMYTLLLAKRMNIDLMNSTLEKLTINETRYPAEKVKGSAKKYNEY